MNRDLHRARQYYRQAADQGDTYAIKALRDMDAKEEQEAEEEEEEEEEENEKEEVGRGGGRGGGGDEGTDGKISNENYCT